MSATRLAAPPVHFHNSVPCSSSSAAKNSIPDTSVKPRGFEPLGPLRRSVTGLAELVVADHSSRPLTRLSAVKYKAPPTFVRYFGFEPKGPRAISATKLAPSPLLVQS